MGGKKRGQNKWFLCNRLPQSDCVRVMSSFTYSRSLGSTNTASLKGTCTQTDSLPPSRLGQRDITTADASIKSEPRATTAQSSRACTPVAYSLKGGEVEGGTPSLRTEEPPRPSSTPFSSLFASSMRASPMPSRVTLAPLQRGCVDYARVINDVQSRPAVVRRAITPNEKDFEYTDQDLSYLEGWSHVPKTTIHELISKVGSHGLYKTAKHVVGSVTVWEYNTERPSERNISGILDDEHKRMQLALKALQT